MSLTFFAIALICYLPFPIYQSIRSTCGPDKHEPGGSWLAHHGYIYKINLLVLNERMFVGYGIYRDILGAITSMPAVTISMFKYAKNMNKRFEVK